MDEENYVYEDDQGWFHTVVDGVDRGSFVLQQTAETMLNQYTGGNQPNTSDISKGGFLKNDAPDGGQGGSTTMARSRGEDKSDADLTAGLVSAGYNGPWDRASMVNAWNRAGGGSSGSPYTIPGVASAGGGGGFPIAGGQGQLDYLIAQLQQQYLRQRLQELEIPGLDLQRRAEILAELNAMSSQTGYFDPSLWQQMLTSIGIGGYGEPTETGKYTTANGEKTMAEMRQEVVDASGGMDQWKNASDEDIRAEFAKLTKGAVTPITTPGESWWNNVNGGTSVGGGIGAARGGKNYPMASAGATGGTTGGGAAAGAAAVWPNATGGGENYPLADTFWQMTERLREIRAQNQAAGKGDAFTRDDYMKAALASGLNQDQATKLTAQIYGYQSQTGQMPAGYDAWAKLANQAGIGTADTRTLARWEAEERLKEQKRQFDQAQGQQSEQYWAGLLASKSGPRDWIKHQIAQSQAPESARTGNLMDIFNATPSFGGTVGDPSNSWENLWQNWGKKAPGTAPGEVVPPGGIPGGGPEPIQPGMPPGYGGGPPLPVGGGGRPPGYTEPPDWQPPPSRFEGPLPGWRPGGETPSGGGRAGGGYVPPSGIGEGGIPPDRMQGLRTDWEKMVSGGTQNGGGLENIGQPPGYGGPPVGGGDRDNPPWIRPDQFRIGGTRPPVGGGTEPPGYIGPPIGGTTRPPSYGGPPLTDEGQPIPPELRDAYRRYQEQRNERPFMPSIVPGGTTRPPGYGGPPVPVGGRPPGYIGPPVGGGTRPPGYLGPPVGGGGGTKPPGYLGPPTGDVDENGRPSPGYSEGPATRTFRPPVPGYSEGPATWPNPTPWYGNFQQPGQIKPNQFRNMTPTQREMLEGQWSAYALDPQDMWTKMKRSWNTGGTAAGTKTRWGM